MLRWRFLFVTALPALTLAAWGAAPTPTPTPVPAEATRFIGGVEALPQSGDANSATSGEGIAFQAPGFHTARVTAFDASSATAPAATNTLAGETFATTARPSRNDAPFTPVAMREPERITPALAPMPAAAETTLPVAAMAATRALPVETPALENNPTVTPLALTTTLVGFSEEHSGKVYSPGGRGRAGAVFFEDGLTLRSGGLYYFDFVTSSKGTLLTDRIEAPSLSFKTSADNPFVIALGTYNASGKSDFLSPKLFDASLSYQWTLVSSGSLDAFCHARFFVDTSGFLNDTKGGSFTVAHDGNDLVLNFTPVPEPSTWVLLLSGIATLTGLSLRRRRC